MAIKRLNYTARKRLRLTDIRFTVTEGSPSAFDCTLALTNYKLPTDAEVFVEAYRQTTWMRFSFGTVGELRPPSQRYLTEFQTPDAILFRVRVTARAGSDGLLLAEADRIRPVLLGDKQSNRRPLLHVRPDDSMGARVFCIDFSEDDQPILLINAQVGNWKDVTRQPAFESLALPQALQEILTRIIFVEEYFDLDDEGEWRSDWLRFASQLPGAGSPPVKEDDRQKKDSWISEAVAAFCRKIRTFDRFGVYLTRHGEA